MRQAEIRAMRDTLNTLETLATVLNLSKSILDDELANIERLKREIAGLDRDPPDK
jgi:hypothetical protein